MIDREEKIIEAEEAAEREKDTATGFTIDNDEKAEWALGKIKEAQEEHDRLMQLVEAQQTALDDRRAQIDKALERDTEYLKHLLSLYMAGVKCKSTKTQDSYQLLSGKLVKKHAALDFSVDGAKLAAWLMENGREDLVKTEIKPMWAEIKKLLTGDPVTGAVTFADTGELVEGIEAKETPEKFSIKFN